MERQGHNDFEKLVYEKGYNLTELLYIMNMVDDETMKRIVSYLKSKDN